MKHFDHYYVDDVIARLRQIDPNARPAWGTLTPTGVIQHLADTVRYSMGKLGGLPDSSTWLSRHVIRPLVIGGVTPIPRNLKAPPFPRKYQGDDLETLQAVLEEYLGLVQAGELEPKPHPFLGDLGVDGWAALHYRHFEHHLRQFGL